MRRLLLAALFASAAARAATLEDQFGREVAIPDPARIFFAADMDASKRINEAFGSAETDLMAEAGVYFVADISGMPKLVAKMFAKPRMREYPYRILLDTTGELSAGWPRTTGAVTVLGQGEPVFCADADCLREALAP